MAWSVYITNCLGSSMRIERCRNVAELSWVLQLAKEAKENVLAAEFTPKKKKRRTEATLER